MTNNTNTPTISAAEQQRINAMPVDQRREYYDRVEYEATKAEHDRKEAELQAKVAAQVQEGLRFNQQIAAQRNGVNTGQALSEGQAKTAEAMKSSNFNQAPQALIDALPVTIGGIQLGPQQAKDMLARGEIKQADYAAAVSAEVSRYGYSFK